MAPEFFFISGLVQNKLKLYILKLISWQISSNWLFQRNVDSDLERAPTSEHCFKRKGWAPLFLISAMDYYITEQNNKPSTKKIRNSDILLQKTKKNYDISNCFLLSHLVLKSRSYTWQVIALNGFFTWQITEIMLNLCKM